jgi:3-deoxy-D-manno-octulosonic-acid transferase
MLAIYNIGIKIYYFLVFLVSPFNKKAKKWISGRRGWKEKWSNYPITSPTAWFHFASLGEFEQGKPLLEAYKDKFPNKKIVITFFSPSGYEIRKNSPLGDYILYLPLDTIKNARDFVAIFKPEVAFFNKYEYWFHFFRALHEKQIPLYVTSAIFRPNQAFFKSFGSFNRQILSFVTHFFVQNKQSQDLLKSIRLHNSTISGDTRFDSVNNLSKKTKDLPFIIRFKADSSLIIAGSSWPEDEKLLVQWFIENAENRKIVFAPHEIKEDKINSLTKLFPDGWVIRHSEIKEQNLADFKVLIIDNIGMLSSLYPYGEIAYIGGGFGAGIHNTLEAAAWGMPVVFGTNYQKFQEAKDLIALEAGFSIANQQELNHILNKLNTDIDYLKQAGWKAKTYVEKNIGATKIIMDKVFQN